MGLLIIGYQKKTDKIIKERFQRQERYSLDNNFV